MGDISMKVRDGFLLKEIAGEYVLVPVGENLVDFSAMAVLNETGAFLWKLMDDETTREELLKAVLEEYDINAEVAGQDIDEFLETMKRHDLLV